MLPQQSSGVLFRDTVEVSAIPDPKVRGVTMFMSSVKDGRWKMKYMCAPPAAAPAPSHALGPGGKANEACWCVV
eukprot:COSAG04_NODE_3869_length_2460_cov_1.938162_1_plen_74_part_00